MPLVADTTSTIRATPTPQAVAVGPGNATITAHGPGVRWVVQASGQSADIDRGHTLAELANVSMLLKDGQTLRVWCIGVDAADVAVTAEVIPS